MKQILIVEDDKGLNYGLCKALIAEDRKLIACQNIKAAKEQLACQIPNLIVLDINLPDGNGLDLLQQIREKSKEPAIILLTAKDMDDDIIKGLEMGADDYITKPFSLAVLRARVNTQLRKFEPISEKIINIGVYSFDFVDQKFYVDNVPIELSKTEQRLLRLLVENKGQIIERSVLLDRIWTNDADYVNENALSVTVKRLRDKLNDKNYIKTVYGIGYMWENKE